MCAEQTEQVDARLRLSERVQSFHLHNNEVGSEAIGSVCLPPNCAHVLMDSVLHYSADPGLSQRPQLQRNRARSMRPCVCVCLHLSDYVITVWQYYFTIYLNSSALSVRRGLLIMLNPVVKLMKNAQNSFIIIV